MTPTSAAAVARDQLRSLAAQGYPINWLGDYSLLSTNTLTCLRSGRARRITARVAEEIASTFLLLNGVSPAVHGVPARGIHMALLQAARGGWGAGDGEVAA
jgi:hypothetical protein